LKTVILAGGLGTRIRTVIDTELPKPMAPVGGKPFLAYLLDYLQQQGIQTVTLSVGYKYAAIKDYFGTQYGAQQLSYAVEQAPLGTGGGLRQALADFPLDEAVLVLNGDTYFPIELAEFVQTHQETQADITLALKAVEQNTRYGGIELGVNQRIINFTAPGSGTKLINAGMYVLKRRVLDKYEFPERWSFENFLTEKTGDLQLYGQTFDEYFIDIGIPEDYSRFQSYMADQ